MPNSCLRRAAAAAVLALCGLLMPCAARGQVVDWPTGAAWEYRRTVEVGEADPRPEIVVTGFLAHGQLRAGAPNLAVYDRRGPVPWHVLQQGPGDYCRLAFQTTEGQPQFYIYYGGEIDPPVASPKWTARTGLMLETRRYRDCNLNNAEAVRAAFDSAVPIGSDFVPTVFHRHNPCAPAGGPFFSRYSGMLRVQRPGKYAFFTSSQDCSFLAIDGKQVVAAPGRHGPVGRARFKGEVKLAAGSHRFEYLHAAAGADACMVAAWQPPGTDKPQMIPAESFPAGTIARLPALRLEQRARGYQPDFRLQPLGEVPLESGTPLVRVRLENVSTRALMLRSRPRWDFGDGQSSEEPSPVHVYLHPGEYTVTLTLRGARRLVATNRLQVAGPLVVPKRNEQPKLDELAGYLPALESYDPAALDGRGLIQLVHAWLQGGQPAKAAAAGNAGFGAEAAERDDQDLWELAQLTAPILRDRLKDSQAAFQLWSAAASAIDRADRAAECHLAAAEIGLSELLQADEARKHLSAAATGLRNQRGEVLSRLYRVWGDYYARSGDGAAAREAYGKAVTERGLRRTAIENNAWRGKYSRSAEAHLRAGEALRAREELRAWQRDFPADKLEGYWSLLEARCFADEQQYAQAVAVAGDLLATNPDSAYADRLLLLSAECEERRGRADRARAAYQSLLTDYPGSPLVPKAKAAAARLASGGGGDNGK